MARPIFDPPCLVRDPYFGNHCVVDVYLKINHISCARKLIEGMPEVSECIVLMKCVASNDKRIQNFLYEVI